MKTSFFALFLCCSLYVVGQNLDLKYLEVEFLEHVEQKIRSYDPNFPTSGDDEYTKLKFKFTNTGKNTLVIDLKDVFALDRINTYYRVRFPSPLTKKKIKLKPNKSISKILHFDMSYKHKPVKLQVEDKMYQIYF